MIAILDYGSGNLRSAERAFAASGKDVVVTSDRKVALEAQGLVVPVLKNADDMSFGETEANIAEFGKKAKDGSLAISDMAGGTFTISNGGVYGSLIE